MEQIFVEIVNRSITAGWVILAVAALRLMVRKAPKWTVCLLWALVAVRLVCPFSLESAFSLIPSRETVHGGSGGLEGNFVDSGIRFLDDAVNPALRNSFDSAATSGAGLNGAAGRDRDTVADTGRYPDADPMGHALSAAGILWIAGMGILALYSLAAYIRLRRRVRTAVRLEGSVYVSEFADTPFILGIARPRIYLPSGMPEEMRALVLAHEQAHLRRLDNLWKLAGYLLVCVYWFHPLVWVAYSLFCRDIELACDESVIKEYDAHGRRMYSEALLACSLDRRAAFGYPLAFGEVGVRERIKTVIHYKKPAFWAIVAAVAVCIAAAICFLTDPVGSGEDSGDGLSLAAGAGKAAGAGTGEGAAGGLDGEGGAARSDGEMPGGEASDSDDGMSGRESQAEGGSSSVDPMDMAGADRALPEAFVNEWAEAFVNRDGNAIESLASEELAGEMLQGPEGQREFGVSSPWPREVDRDIRVLSVEEEKAQVCYYAWTSDSHVSVWREEISYELQEGRYMATAESLTYLDDISTNEAFGMAYDSCPIDGSAMDYESNGAGEDLNANALLSSTEEYRGLFEPEGAAVALLNLSDDPSEVRLERIYEESGSVNLEILFLKDEDALPIPITMVQPYGEEGIWIPKDYAVDVIARFQRMDWDEIRSRHLSVTNDPGIWRDVICIAEIPEESIKIYGYNDAERSGEGVAIEIGRDVNYFDWIYTSAQCRLPECYWNQADGQLQVALNVYTGTGVFAQELHVLQYDDDNVLQDYALELDEMQEKLYERIGYYIGEDKKSLWLFDKRNHKQLGKVDISESGAEGLELELGLISSYSLGEGIKLLVEPGYWVEGSAIAEYPEDMPQLEVEVLLSERDGKIQLAYFGEIKGDPESVEFIESVE